MRVCAVRSEDEDDPNITRALLEHGYEPDEIRRILGGNFLRIFREVIG